MKAIRFNPDDYCAMSESRKTQKRRIIKPQPFDGNGNIRFKQWFDRDWYTTVAHFESDLSDAIYEVKPHYKKGDILYVQEAFLQYKDTFYFKADGKHLALEELGIKFKWKPSIHMPKESARMFLEVTNVRIERLQDITEQDAIAEGVSKMFDHRSDKEYQDWSNRRGIKKAKSDWGWRNYLWHGLYGMCGEGNKMTDAWEYQESGYDSPISSYSSLWNSRIRLRDWDKFGWDANPWVEVDEFKICDKKVGNESNISK